MNTAGTLMEGGMEATWFIFVVVLLGLVISFSKERKLQREKNYKGHGDIWSERGRVEGKGEVKRGEEIELLPFLFAVIVIFYFRSPKVQKLSLEKPICYFCIYSYIY